MEVMFESYLRSKMKNEKTVRGYVKDINMFLDYLKQMTKSIEDVKESDVKEYNLMLMEKDYSNNTVARKNSALRLYFKYLRRTGKMYINPMEDIKQPELQQRYNEITEKMIKELMESIDNERDNLMIAMMYYEKIKPIEFLKMKKQNYDLKTNILYLENKVVLLKEETKVRMINYIGKMGEENRMFLNQHSKELTPSGVYFIIKKYLKNIGKEEIRPIDFTKKETKE